ncbi:MAG: hypothetical protein KJ067_05665 [Vicinamibacteria bacterium]|nr:hypothetical protein [Vicinamibacteria bacterium]
MTRPTAHLLLGAAFVFGAFADEGSRPTPSYTDADLARYAAMRAPLDAAEPAPTPAPTARGRAKRDQTVPDDLEREAAQRASEERYWRREAEKARAQARRHEERAAVLEAQAAERRRAASRARPGSAPPAVAAAERRAQVEREQARHVLDQLEERARREGALPGWIR